MNQSFLQRRGLRVCVGLAFAVSGFLIPMESPSLSLGLVSIAFFLFPLAFITPILACFIRRMKRRRANVNLKPVLEPQYRIDNDPSLFRSAGLAFIGFGVIALLRAVVFQEAIGIQCMPIGFGLALYLGVVVGSRTH
jgi:hypothetical protein